ncbi:MAG: ABC transporter permease, partial [Terriglobales bacterium]
AFVVAAVLGLAAAALTLALGMRAALDGTVPWPDASRTYQVSFAGGGFAGIAPVRLEKLRQELGLQASFAGWVGQQKVLTTGGRTATVHVVVGSPQLLEMLGARALVGTLQFSPPSAAVISEALWRQHFGGSHDVVGKIIELDDREFRVTGVVPTKLVYPAGTEVWLPLRAYPAVARIQSFPLLTLLARPRKGMSRAALGAAITKATGKAAQLEPFVSVIEGSARLRTALLVTGTALLLLVAWLNAALVLLAAVNGRTQEFAIKQALGMGRRQLLAELSWHSLAIGFAGCGLGALVVWLSYGLAPSLHRAGLRIGTTAIVSPILVVAAGALLCGGISARTVQRPLAPAVRVRGGYLGAGWSA